MKTHIMPIMKRDGRDCDARELIRQIGSGNLLAISGGSWASMRVWDDPNDMNCFRVIGAVLPCGRNRMVEITLDFSDTYIVRRVRRIDRGVGKNTAIVEFEQRDVYCDEVGEVAYQASCWR
jgi:hypothetical protein